MGYRWAECSNGVCARLLPSHKRRHSLASPIKKKGFFLDPITPYYLPSPILLSQASSNSCLPSLTPFFPSALRQPSQSGTQCHHSPETVLVNIGPFLVTKVSAYLRCPDYLHLSAVIPLPAHGHILLLIIFSSCHFREAASLWFPPTSLEESSWSPLCTHLPLPSH